MIYNYLPDSIWRMKIPSNAKVIAERICALTKNGEKECFVSNDFLSKQLGMTKKTVQSSLSILEELKIILTKITKRNDKKIRLVYFIYQEIDGQICQKVETDSVKNTLSESVNFSNEKCKFFHSESVKNTLSSIQSNDLGVRRESNDQKTTHSTSSNSFVFSVQKAEEILSTTSDELNVSLSSEKLHSEALKFFDYYSEKKLSIGQLKVKARTWIDNCKKYPDFKNKKYQSHSTAADGGLLGILKEECEKEKELKQSSVITTNAVNEELVFPDFTKLSEKENGYPMLLEYPNHH